MNEHPVRVIKVTPEMVSKHENADTLSVVTIEGYTVCTQTKDIPEGGGVAAYIEPDSLVNTELEEFSFLKSEAKFNFDSTRGGEERYARIRVKKLRGVPSMGLLVWLDHTKHSPGQDVTDVLDVFHYEKPETLQKGLARREPPGYHPAYASIENFKKQAALSQFVDGEKVVATEKIHGSNARYTIDSNTSELCVGSHRRWLDSSDENTWKTAVEKTPGVLKYLNDNPTHTVYGEIFGPSVQGAKAGYGEKDFALVVFDILQANGAFLDFEDFLKAAMDYSIPIVPVVYLGPFDKEVLTELAEGISPTHADTVMEGLVVKPIKERRCKSFNRVMAKLISNRYYLKSE